MPRRARCRTFDFDPDMILYDEAVDGMDDRAGFAYFLLLCHAWKSKDPGVLEYDARRFARLTRRSLKSWNAIREAVARAFDTTTTPGLWVTNSMRTAHELQNIRVINARSASVSRWKGPKPSADPHSHPPDSRLPTPESLRNGGLSPPIPPTPNGASLQSLKESVTDSVPRTSHARAMVSGLARVLEMPKAEADWRPEVWEDAQAIGLDLEQANLLMEFAGWARKHLGADRYALQRMFRAIVQGRIKNPIAYFSENGHAYQAIIGEQAVERHEREQREYQRADREFFSQR